jgi:hypothetical protein
MGRATTDRGEDKQPQCFSLRGAVWSLVASALLCIEESAVLGEEFGVDK